MSSSIFWVTGCKSFHPPVYNMNRSVTSFGSILASITLVHEFFHPSLSSSLLFSSSASKAVMCSTNSFNPFPQRTPASSSQSVMFQLFRLPISCNTSNTEMCKSSSIRPDVNTSIPALFRLGSHHSRNMQETHAMTKLRWDLKFLALIELFSSIRQVVSRVPCPDRLSPVDVPHSFLVVTSFILARCDRMSIPHLLSILGFHRFVTDASFYSSCFSFLPSLCHSDSLSLSLSLCMH